MHAKGIAASCIVALAAFAGAEPIPINRRFDVGNAIDSATAIANSYYNEATSAAASWYAVGLSAASSGLEEGLSDASTWLQSHGGEPTGGPVFATVTSVSGAVESIVTSVGGGAITLAASGSGVVTSFAGSQYTIIASPTNTANVAVRIHSVSFAPMLTALVTVVGGTLFGAWVTL